MRTGVVLVNKPTGMSSNTCVRKVGKSLGIKKVGHMGTLDPMGAGLLPVLCGKATRLFDLASNKTKTYRAVFLFGIETDTLDSEGKIINISNKIISEEMIKEHIKDFAGEQEQMPPVYSAKKINGIKACDRARSGEEVELKTKKVCITSFKLLKRLKKNAFLFEIECSEGTYIRSLCRDLAYKLSTYGTMCAICRTRCGIMQIDNSYAIDEIDNHVKFINVTDFLDMPLKTIQSKYFEDLKNGRKIPCESVDGKFKLFCGEVFWGVGHEQDGFIEIDRNFFEENDID